MYQRLQDLEEATRTFLTPKVKILTPELGSFSEIDIGEYVTFEMVLDSFGNNSVLCLSIFTSPTYMSEEFQVEEDRLLGITRQDDSNMQIEMGLQVTLVQIDAIGMFTLHSLTIFLPLFL